MRRVLIVANLTSAGKAVQDEVTRRIAEGPVKFTLLVPASESASERALTWEENEVWNEAKERMERAVATLQALGADIDGRVGAHDPYAAAMDLFRTEPFDEIIVSTLAPSRSRWLGLDLPNRLARHTGVPVVHVVGEPAEQVS
jgi:hypothetical protein